MLVQSSHWSTKAKVSHDCFMQCSQWSTKAKVTVYMLPLEPRLVQSRTATTALCNAEALLLVWPHEEVPLKEVLDDPNLAVDDNIQDGMSTVQLSRATKACQEPWEVI